MTMTGVSTGAFLARNSGLRRTIVTAAMVACADWLFFRHPTGVSAAVFVVVLAFGTLLTNPVRADRRALAIAGAILGLAIAPAVYAATPMAIGFALLAGAHFALVATGRSGMRIIDRVATTMALLIEPTWRLLADGVRTLSSPSKLASDAETNRVARRRLPLAWIMPLALGGLFLLLFRSANPLIKGWLDQIDLSVLTDEIGLTRIAFWLGALALIWPFAHVTRRAINANAWLTATLHEFSRGRRTDRPEETAEDRPDGPPSGPQPSGGAAQIFGRSAIIYSLVVFNLLFAVQTALDLAYLWGGVDLPEGMTYAAYAHRGAYPLVATALLAAAFVLAAMRPGSESAASPIVRALVYVWIAQNVLLVTSSIYRLDLYVAVYSLTYLRVAALIWMALVVVGLVLIVVRIALGRNNRWLVAGNTAALALVLFGCGFVNFPSVIAHYNVDHSREVSGRGRPLDLDYLLSLGPHAIPALDRYAGHRPDLPDWVIHHRASLVSAHQDRFSDWRAWSVREGALHIHLEYRAPSYGGGEDRP